MNSAETAAGHSGAPDRRSGHPAVTTAPAAALPPAPAAARRIMREPISVGPSTAPFITLSADRVMRYRPFTMKIHINRSLAWALRLTDFDVMRAGLGAKCRLEENPTRDVTSCFCTAGKRVLEIGVSNKESFGPVVEEDTLVYTFDRCKTNCSSSRDHHKSRLILVIDDRPLATCGALFSPPFAVQARDKVVTHRTQQQPGPVAPSSASPARSSQRVLDERGALLGAVIERRARECSTGASSGQADSSGVEVAAAVAGVAGDAPQYAKATTCQDEQTMMAAAATLSRRFRCSAGGHIGPVVAAEDCSALASASSSETSSPEAAAAAAPGTGPCEGHGIKLSSDPVSPLVLPASPPRTVVSPGRGTAGGRAERTPLALRAMLVMGQPPMPLGPAAGTRAYLMVRVFGTLLNELEVDGLVASFADVMRSLPGYHCHGWRVRPGFLVTFSSFATPQTAERGLAEVQRYLRNDGYANPYGLDLTSNMCCLISYCTNW